jgi:hypothetical protein
MGAFDSVTKKISSLVGITAKGQATAANSGYASGWQDDGTESGVVRTRLVRGELVPIPIQSGTYTAIQNGSSFVQQNDTGIESNEDGTGTNITIQASSGTAQGAGIQTILYGTVIGVRWRRDTSAANFSVMVDGVAYSVSATPLYNGVSITLTDTECLMVIAQHLTDGPHSVGVYVPPDPSVTRTLQLYGFLLERRAGYLPKPRAQAVMTPVVLTTAGVEIPHLRGTTRQLSGIRKILYCNTTAGAITVTVQINSVTCWSRSIPANETYELDFGGITATDATYKHLASANSSVTATVVGGD